MIPYGRQDVNEEDIRAVVDVLRSDWLTTGPIVRRFEEAVKQWTGGTPSVAVSSGTAALHAAYAAAGLGPGDEVLTPPITFVATQATLVHVGATPVFVDVDPETALISPSAVQAAVGPRTAAIVAVDYAGHPADMDELRTIANKYQLLLIEDSAHSLGSIYKNRYVGSLADITAFSFYPTKNITTAEGGAVSSADEGILKRAQRFSRQGLVRNPQEFRVIGEGDWHQEVHTVGLNYRLSDVHAALGISQLSRLQSFKQRRKQIKAAYDEFFDGIEGVDVPTQRSYVDPMWHLYPLRVPPEQRRKVFDSLRRAGIGVQVNYLPAYRHPVFEGLVVPQAFPGSESYYAREISLPIHVGLGEAEMAKIVETTLSILKGSR